MLSLVSAASKVAAQGTLLFQNAASSLITSNGTVASGNPPVAGMKATLYYSTDTNNFDPASYAFLPESVTTVGASGLNRGRFSGGTKTLTNVAPGSFINAFVCAWPAAHPTWESAGGFTPYCRQYVVKGRSAPFRIGPLGTDGLTAAPLTNLPPIGVGVSFATELCEPLLMVAAEPPSFRLRIDMNGSSVGNVGLEIRGSSTLVSNSWQVLTNFYPTNSVVFWTDPMNTSPRFYRVRAHWPGN